MKPEKRLFDLFFASALLLLTFPLLLVIAGALRLENRGTIFFKRRRHGLNSVPFEIFKFRTYPPGAARATGLGEFLRRTCLDELPQLWNVLKGELSLVGPRPLDVDESDALAEQFPLHHARHAVRPGITGSGQVMGMRGTLDEPEKAKRLLYDLKYAAKNSVWGDLKILVQTPYCVAQKFIQTRGVWLDTSRWQNSGGPNASALAADETSIPTPGCLTVAELGA